MIDALKDAEAAGLRIGHGRDCVLLQPIDPLRWPVMTGEQAIRLGVALIQQGHAAIECGRG